MSEASELLLADLLIKHGLFDRSAFEEVMKTRLVHETSIRDLLVNRKLVTENKILEVLNAEHHYPIANLTFSDTENDLFKKVSPVHATTFKIFPLRMEDKEIVLGMVDVLDDNLFDDLRFALPFPFKVELISTEDHRELILKSYGEKPQDLSEIVNILTNLDEEQKEHLDEADAAVNDAPVVRLLNSILVQAITDHASDIHFEPFEEEFRIRYRMDGTLYEMIPPPKSLALSVLSRIKVMARMNIAEKRIPQDGRISLNLNKRSVDLRVSTIPTTYGESAVLRILDRSNVALNLDNLGFSREMLKTIREIIQKPNGIFVTTGPTGAGKTTTLYSCIREINTVDSKIITTEDPVEYDIEGITQVPINESIGLTFALCLRSILRQDPDKIMVGEIRDLETMNMAIQASLTGHLVLSTLHTNDASSAITRLIDMGVEPFLICSALEGILAQRLVRKLCTHCKTPYVPDERMLKLIGLKPQDTGNKKFFAPKGCEECGGIGYKGRLGIYELLTINTEIRRLIMQRVTAKMIRDAARKKGMTSLLEDGIQKIEAGVTTIEEVAACAIEGDKVGDR
jgi:type IV pilus assembly protein PilB